MTRLSTIALIALLSAGAAGRPGGQAARPADALLAEALSRARAENKAVFVDFGASWCGPCRALDGFLAAPDVQPILEDRFVVLKLTNWERGALAARNNPGATELASKWGGGDGIPFFAVLDDTGRVLGTGSGFPGSRRSALRFLALLSGAAPSLAGAPTDKLSRALAERSDGKGVISGRVTDAGGTPVADATVTAHGRAYLDGTWKPVRLARVTTDGDGVYSADVAAGDLLLTAEPPPGGAHAPVTFLGDVRTSAESARISLEPGEGLTSVDVRLAPASTVRIAGTVVGSRGQPLAGAAVALTHVDWPSLTFGTTTDAAGRFSFSDAPAGRFTVWARGTAPNAPADSRIEGGAAIADTVAGAPVDVRLSTRPPVRLIGRVVFEGPAMSAADRAPVRITAVAPALPPGVPSGLPQSAVNPDGSFTVTSQHGSRVVRVAGLPAGWMLKSVTRRGQDVTDVPLSASGTDDITDLVVTVTASAAAIDGRLVNEDGSSHRGGVAVVFPQDSSRMAYPSRFVRRGVVQDDGSFTVGPLPAGDYLIAGLAAAERNWDAPESLEALRAGATALTIGPGERKTLTLTVTTMQATPSHSPATR